MVAAISSTLFDSLGALMTGFAALLTAVISVRVSRKRARDECDERIAQQEAAFDKGMGIGQSIRRPR